MALVKKCQDRTRANIAHYKNKLILEQLPMKIKNINIKSTAGYVLVISLFISPNLLKAEDTEVFLNNDTNPNLLFLMDLSGSMNWGINAKGYNSNSGKIDVGTPPSRIDVMKNALRRVLIQAPDGINIGVMNYGPGGFDGADSRLFWNERYRSHAVDGVAFPITDIDGLVQPIVNNSMNVDNLPDPDSDTTTREYIADIVDSWQPYGGTPIVDSLVEAARYFSGEKMYFGYDVPSGPRGSHPSTHEGPVVLRDLLTTPRPTDFSATP